MESVLSEEEVVKLARLTHEVNKTLCEEAGDFSQPSWDDAPDWQKESAVEGVIRSANHIAQFNQPLAPEESHNLWMSKKLRGGWRYGEVKDPHAKTHPCLLPWRELPWNDRLKDVMFGAIVHFYSAYRD